MYSSWACCFQIDKIQKDLQSSLPPKFWSYETNNWNIYILQNSLLNISISFTPFNYIDYYCEIAVLYRDVIIYPRCLGYYYDVKILLSKQEMIDEILFLYHKIRMYERIFKTLIHRWRDKQNIKKATSKIVSFICKYIPHYFYRPGGLYFRQKEDEWRLLYNTRLHR